MARQSLTAIVLVWLMLLGISFALAATEATEPLDYRYCTTCHGTDGRGNEAVQAPRLAGMEAWYLTRQLQHFRAGIRGTHSQDTAGLAMQPMAAQLTDQGIAAIVRWAGSWNQAPAEITVVGDEVRGRQLYTACAVCHGDRAEGNEALGAPALAGQNDWYLVTQLENFVAGHRGAHPDDRYGQQMRAVSGTLSGDADIRDVVSYINTLVGR